MFEQENIASRPARRGFWMWLAFLLVWVSICTATLRPDRPISILMHYCAQFGGLLSCSPQQPGGLRFEMPAIEIARKNLLFFALISLGTPVLVLAMGRAARWAAGGADD
jgi:hypothetical protein